MKLVSTLLPAVLALLGTGCSSSLIKTDFDYDPGADYGRLQTYDWIQDASGAPQDLVSTRVRRALDEGLTARGFVRQPGPDFLVAVQLGVQQRVAVTHRRYYRGSTVYTWGEGALVVDEIDTRGMQLVWRGIARGAIDRNRTPEER